MHLFVVSVTLLDPAGRLLLVRKRDTLVFMLPGGKVEPGEAHVAAAVREVAEEVGIILDPGSVRLLGHWSAAAANEPGLTISSDVFRAPFEGAAVASGEIEEIAWLDLTDAAALSSLPLAPLLIEHVVPALLAGTPATHPGERSRL